MPSDLFWILVGIGIMFFLILIGIGVFEFLHKSSETLWRLGEISEIIVRKRKEVNEETQSQTRNGTSS